MSNASRQGFLGKDQDRVLGLLRIGIVGLGGGGAAICQQLAHVGFRNLLLIDPDRIEDTNLNRLIGGTRLDVFLKRKKVDIAARTVRRLREADVELAFSKWQDRLEDLKACDIILGALDGFLERQELEGFCRRFLIPYIDIGMDVVALPDGDHLISGQVITSLPGGPCMRCCHFITDERLTTEANKYGAAGVRPQVVWPNGILASAAVGELMSLVLPWFKRPKLFNYLVYDANANELRVSPHVAGLEGVTCPHHPWTQVGDPFFKTDQNAPERGLVSWLKRRFRRSSMPGSAGRWHKPLESRAIFNAVNQSSDVLSPTDRSAPADQTPGRAKRTNSQETAVNETTIVDTEEKVPVMLGPFLGHVTATSIKIWLHLEGGHDTVWVTLHPSDITRPAVATAQLSFNDDNLFADCVEIDGLEADQLHFYGLWTNPACSLPLPLQGLRREELRFRTLSDDPDEQIDFVVMSCHNPTIATDDGHDGYGVWIDLPQIIARDNNKKVRFALLVGDQIYADKWEEQLLQEPDAKKRLRMYLEAYRTFWSNIHYRRVLCSLPSVMMWDDHDITDGWGSRTVSFVEETSVFKKEWQSLLASASQAFSVMQASRNPPAMSPSEDGFDFGFRVGPWAFLFLDLRTHRNLKLKRLFSDAQFARLRNWVDDNRAGTNTLFVISPVVFSHGSPVIDDLVLNIWPGFLKVINWLARMIPGGKGLQTRFDKSIGDITDDIRDSWGSKENSKQTDQLLDYLFEVQNDPIESTGVVILSGDIHTSGYASIFSSDQKHERRSSIPHVTSSSVAYTPFHWLLEAIYRHATKSVKLGARGAYASQISHHVTARSVAVLSLRPSRTDGEYALKVKYYLEGYPEPYVVVFDLAKSSHRENITWTAQEKVSEAKYAPTAQADIEAQLQAIDIEAVLAAKAARGPIKLNWRQSIVDLMKVLDLDSSLGARTKLAQKWGYAGALDGSAEMNVWLHQQMIAHYQEAGGRLPEDLAAAAAPIGPGDPA